MRRALAIAATSFALLATGCSSATQSTETPAAEAAAAEAPAAQTTQAPLPVIKGAPQNGGGIVYHRSDCGYNNVRWYGAGGDGSGSACGTWGVPAWQRDVIHSFDWNFKTEDLTFVTLNTFNTYQKFARWGPVDQARSWERTFFEQVNQINGGRGNSFRDLINNNLPGHDIGDGKTTPGRWF
jgi:hypothetical protein